MTAHGPDVGVDTTNCPNGSRIWRKTHACRCIRLPATHRSGPRGLIAPPTPWLSPVVSAASDPERGAVTRLMSVLLSRRAAERQHASRRRGVPHRFTGVRPVLHTRHPGGRHQRSHRACGVGRADRIGRPTYGFSDLGCPGGPPGSAAGPVKGPASSPRDHGITRRETRRCGSHFSIAFCQKVIDFSVGGGTAMNAVPSDATTPA